MSRTSRAGRQAGAQRERAGEAPPPRLARARNRFSAGAKQTGQLLEIGLVASTRMHCEGKMDAEMRYFTALQAVRSYALDRDTLSLVAADRHVLLKLTRQP